jgi:hypothetical protein
MLLLLEVLSPGLVMWSQLKCKELGKYRGAQQYLGNISHLCTQTLTWRHFSHITLFQLFWCTMFFLSHKRLNLYNLDSGLAKKSLFSLVVQSNINANSWQLIYKSMNKCVEYWPKSLASGWQSKQNVPRSSLATSKTGSMFMQYSHIWDQVQDGGCTQRASQSS